MTWTIALSAIPRVRMLPEGPWTLEIVGFEEDHDPEDEMRLIIMERRSVWPVEGFSDFEYYKVGIPGDRECLQPDSQAESQGMAYLMKCLDVARVPGMTRESIDAEELFQNAKGRRFDVLCTHLVDDGTKNPENKGRIYKRLALRPANTFKRETERDEARTNAKAPPPIPSVEATQAAVEAESSERATGRPGLNAGTKSPGPSLRAPGLPIPKRRLV